MRSEGGRRRQGGRGRLWATGPLVAALMLISAVGCMVDGPYIFRADGSVVCLEGNRAQAAPSMYFVPAVKDSLDITVYASLFTSIKLEVDSEYFLVDLYVSPKALVKHVEFHANRMLVVLWGDTLSLAEQRISCGPEDACYHRAAFRLSPVRDERRFSSDSVCCILDLDDVLTFRGEPLRFGILSGWLPWSAE